MLAECSLFAENTRNSRIMD